MICRLDAAAAGAAAAHINLLWSFHLFMGLLTRLTAHHLETLFFWTSFALFTTSTTHCLSSSAMKIYVRFLFQCFLLSKFSFFCSNKVRWVPLKNSKSKCWLRNSLFTFCLLLFSSNHWTRIEFDVCRLCLLTNPQAMRADVQNTNSIINFACANHWYK